MVPRELIEEVLKAGIRAPSGENSQPWRFKVEGERVWLFNRPEADQSLFNFHQNGSLVSHGAVLANMKIAATHFGYDAKIAFFPDETKEDLVATMDFKDAEPEAAAKMQADLGYKLLFEAIAKRVTNRKHYDGTPLKPNEKQEILGSENWNKNLVVATAATAAPGGADEAVRLVVIEDRSKIAGVARAASTSETMLVMNREVHDFFFSHVRWTPEENESQPNGFFVPTLELNAQQAKGFKLLRHWNAARVLAKLGVAKQVGKDNEETYKTASAMFAVVIKDSQPKNLLRAGKVLEHAWLTATKLGLSVQPSTGALFLAEGVRHENWHSFSEPQRNALLAARASIYDIFDIDPHGEHIAVIFRVGRAEPPSAQAARFPLETFLQP